MTVDICHSTAALLKFGKTHHCLVSAPIFRVNDQRTVKYHHFENYKDLYGEWVRLAHSAHLPYKKPYNNRNVQIDGASQYFGVRV